MLFIIDESIAEALSTQDEPDDGILEAVEYVARARQYGYHLLFASRSTLEVLRRCNQLENSARNVYERIYSQLPQMGALPGKFTRHIEVVSNELAPNIRIEGHTKVLRIPASHLANMGSVAETTLLCENQSDCDFYAAIAEVYLIRADLKTIRIVLEPRGGGGSTVSVAYRSLQKRNRQLCLCVVDSDKKHPEGTIGETARLVEQANDPEQLFCEHLIIRSREVENLIPTPVLSSIATPQIVRAIMFLEALAHSTVIQSRWYIDIKDGLKLGEIHHTSDEQERTYWTRIYQEIKAFACNIEHGCEVHPQCQNKDECKCFVMPGLGKNILDRTLEFVKAGSLHRLERNAHDHTKSEWEEIGRVVSSWCCGGSPIRSVRRGQATH